MLTRGLAAIGRVAATLGLPLTLSRTLIFLAFRLYIKHFIHSRFCSLMNLNSEYHIFSHSFEYEIYYLQQNNKSTYNSLLIKLRKEYKP